MPAFEGRSSPHRWSQIKALPLLPTIRTLDEYEEAVMRGGAESLVYLRGVQPLGQFSVADMQQVHFLMFKWAHPWAGQFRQPGQMAIVAGFPAADPPRIVRELELALVQLKEMLEAALSAGDARHSVGALAFFHVRFERVHPFLDGNGRAGRAILAVQFEKLFGVLPRFLDQAGYRDAVRAANRGDLAPLINHLGASAGLQQSRMAWPAPFKLAPRFLEGPDEDTTFAADLAWSRNVS